MRKSVLSTLVLLGTAWGAWAQQPSQPRGLHSPRPQLEAGRSMAAGPFQLVQELYQVPRNTAWLDSTRWQYSRFTAASLPQRTQYANVASIGTPLRTVREYHTRYNAANQVTIDSTYSVNVTTGALTPAVVITNTYNTLGQLFTKYEIVRAGTSWQPYFRETYSYNAAGQLTQLASEGFMGNTAYNDFRELYTYNALGQLISTEFQLAQQSGPGYDPLFRDLFSYNNAGKLLVDVQQSYNNGAYADTYRTTYSYGPNGLQSGYVLERNAGTWTILERSQVTYDADNNLTRELRQRYNPTTQTYKDIEQHLLTYQRVLNTRGAQALEANLMVAPNPAPASQAAVRYTLPTAAAAVSVQVLDAVGRVVSTLQPPTTQAAGLHTLALGPLHLAPGLYIVRLQAGAKSQQVKVVVN